MVSKIAKVVGFIGGVAAILWAMRDRFIQVSVSREPQPPVFRGTTSNGSPPVQSIKGIGPTYSTRLKGAGISSAADLAKATPEDVAQIAGVGLDQARGWIDQANS